MKPGTTVFPSRSIRLVRAVARFSTSSSEPTAMSRPRAIATACAFGCLSSIVIMLPLCRMSSASVCSNGNRPSAPRLARNSRRFGSASPPPPFPYVPQQGCGGERSMRDLAARNQGRPAKLPGLVIERPTGGFCSERRVGSQRARRSFFYSEPGSEVERLSPRCTSPLA